MQVKRSVGLKRMHKLLIAALMRAARSGLRWSGDFARLSMYIAMLLKVCGVPVG